MLAADDVADLLLDDTVAELCILCALDVLLSSLCDVLSLRDCTADEVVVLSYIFSDTADVSGSLSLTTILDTCGISGTDALCVGIFPPSVTAFLPSIATAVIITAAPSVAAAVAMRFRVSALFLSTARLFSKTEAATS